MAILYDFRDGVSRYAKRVIGYALPTSSSEPEDIRSYISANSVRRTASSERRPASGPLRVSLSNGRYFADPSGRIVYLAGSHTWTNLQNVGVTDPPPSFDYTIWLDFLESQNHNFFRLWTWEQAKWSVDAMHAAYVDPLPYARAATTRGLATDGKPKFDLLQFNQAYFDLLRGRVIEAGERGIYVSIMMFNGWSVAFPKGSEKANNPWLAHPFNARNNVNDIDGDPDGDNSGVEVHELSDPKIRALQEAYVRKVVDSVNDLDNVLFEISNESDGRSVAWQYHMIDHIQRYEASKPKQHPVGMTVPWPNGDNTTLYASNAEWISPNGNLHDRPSADGRKVVVADTDHFCGICGDRKWVWMSFTRGENPLFMDRYDNGYRLRGESYDLSNPKDVDLRKNLGYTRYYADRLDMAVMVPHGELATSGHALASPGRKEAEYLVYLPSGGRVKVDLSGADGTLNVEWFNPATGVAMSAGRVPAGGTGLFTAPFDGDAVLYLHRAGNN